MIRAPTVREGIRTLLICHRGSWFEVPSLTVGAQYVLEKSREEWCNTVNFKNNEAFHSVPFPRFARESNFSNILLNPGFRSVSLR